MFRVQCVNKLRPGIYVCLGPAPSTAVYFDLLPISVHLLDLLRRSTSLGLRLLRSVNSRQSFERLRLGARGLSHRPLLRRLGLCGRTYSMWSNLLDASRT